MAGSSESGPGPDADGVAGCLDREPLGTCLFFPRACGPAGATFVDGGDGVRLASYRVADHPGAGWLLHFHGNGELAREYAEDDSGPLRGLGVNVCFADYRGYGPSTGRPTLRNLLDDAAAQLRGLGVPPGRVVVYGRSLGSLAAIELAARNPDLAGVIVESGIADLAERLLEYVEQAEVPFPLEAVPAEVLRHFDHRAKLAAYRGPLLVIHAEGDDLIPPSHARDLHAWGGGTDRTLLLLPRGDHNSLIALNREAYRAAVAGFVGRVGVRG
jgi:pimeloyl-ACP methyl ester carboxylesterase